MGEKNFKQYDQQGLTSKIYKQVVQFNIKKKQTIRLKNGQKPEQTYFQRRFTDGQQVVNSSTLKIVGHKQDICFRSSLTPILIPALSYSLPKVFPTNTNYSIPHQQKLCFERLPVSNRSKIKNIFLISINIPLFRISD